MGQNIYCVTQNLEHSVLPNTQIKSPFIKFPFSTSFHVSKIYTEHIFHTRSTGETPAQHHEKLLLRALLIFHFSLEVNSIFCYLCLQKLFY